MAVFLAAIVDGLITGSIYALMAMGFVVTYKTLRVANFAMGELILYGTGFAALGYHALGIGLLGALVGGCVGMIAGAGAFNRLVFGKLGHAAPITLLMLTLGLGTFLQGLAPWLFRFHGLRVPLALPRGVLDLHGVLIYVDELLIGALAVLGIAAVGAFFRWSRAGLALRAMADDPAVAPAMGVNPQRYGTLAWSLAGCIAVLDGVLWGALRGGGFGLELIGLRVFPIVIIGGLDSLPGTILGGIGVGVLDSLVATYVDVPLGINVSQVVSFVLLITVLMVRPQGLLGSERIERV